MTIEVPIDVMAGELRDLFSTPKSIELMKDTFPDFDAMHKIVEMNLSTHMVYEEGGLRSTVDLTPVGDRTTVTIRVLGESSNREAAAIAALAQLCSFEFLEQGYNAGLKNRRTRTLSMACSFVWGEGPP